MMSQHEDLFVQLKMLLQNRDVTRRLNNVLCRPLSEVDLSHFKKISYSYFEMPINFPRPICKGRYSEGWKDICQPELNELFTSIPQGSEHFKFKIRNQYEEILFKIEDEMFKFDHELGNIKTTMQILEVEKMKLEEMT
jgi:histone deacetylase complex regulatory component SIN3